jgi:hypothetical protein
MKKLLVFLLLLVATAAQAETYKWTDKQGTVHFSDSLQSVPSAYRKVARPLALDNSSGSISTGASSAQAAAPADSSASGGIDMGQVDGLKQRMMNDQGIMAIITAMQGDPEMQAVLSDPSVMAAIQSGDTGSLMNNPAFMKLLKNPRVKQIEKMLQQGGAK